ncbi:MAG: hypothetical protein ACM3MG_10570 [Bacillota bacterium]
MNKFKSIQFALITLMTLSTSTMVQAASGRDYEEVSYEDLVGELSHKKDILTQSQNSANAPKTHIGIGYANSFSNIAANGQNFNRYSSGVQLSYGMDMGSPRWYTEGIFRNYGSNSNGTEDFSLRDLELKAGYTNIIQNIWNYSLSTGLSTRFMKFSDSSRNINVDETTPSLVVSSGIFAQIHRNVSIGAEVSARTAMTNKPADKDSFDFAFRLNTSL